MRLAPCWNDGDAALFCGDAVQTLGALPRLEAAALVCDPPYCSGGFQEAGRRASRGVITDEGLAERGWFRSDNMGTAGLCFLLRAALWAADRHLREGASAIFFCDWRMYPSLAPALESSGWRLQNLIVWDKGSAGQGAGFRTQHELAIVLTKGSAPVYHSSSAGNVLEARRVPPAKRHHPTEKPVALLEQIIEVVSAPGELILDPFAGASSTGVAALRMGRRFVGVEGQPSFCEVGAARLAGAGRSLKERQEGQASLFEEAAA